MVANELPWPVAMPVLAMTTPSRSSPSWFPLILLSLGLTVLPRRGCRWRKDAIGWARLIALHATSLQELDRIITALKGIPILVGEWTMSSTDN